MELNNYLMTRSISELDDEINSLGKKKSISKPVDLTADAGDIGWIILEGLKWSALSFGIIVAIIGVVIGAIIDGYMAIPFAFIGYIAGTILGTIGIAIWIYTSDNKDCRRKYKEDCDEYDKKIQNEEMRVKTELRTKDILLKQRDSLIERKTEASRKLNSFYMAVGIDKNYRNLIPIGYMYEFMSLGIATKLEGADGLYYLVRRELRADQMQYTLDEISFKLDTIIDNQHRIYGELTEINNKCDRIISETVKSAELAARNNEMLSVAVANTAITAYNSERIASEAKFQSYMTMYNS